MSRAAVFFDRDGVLIEDCGYPHRPEHLALIPGAIAAVRRVNALGHAAVVVTNQSGVARGLFSEAQMHAFHDLLRRAFEAEGARIDAIYACPYLADAVVEAYRHPDHPDRKPNPGMLLRAIADLDLDPARSLMVGDKASDMEAAQRAGVRGVMFEGGDLDILLAAEL